MKTTFKTLAIILTVLMLSVINSAKATPMSFENGQLASSYCGVTDAQVIEYMERVGYQVQTISPITGSCNVIVKTTSGSRFILIINNNQIVGHEEVMV